MVRHRACITNGYVSIITIFWALLFIIQGALSRFFVDIVTILNKTLYSRYAIRYIATALKEILISKRILTFTAVTLLLGKLLYRFAHVTHIKLVR